MTLDHPTTVLTTVGDARSAKRVAAVRLLDFAEVQPEGGAPGPRKDSLFDVDGTLGHAAATEDQGPVVTLKVHGYGYGN